MNENNEIVICFKCKGTGKSLNNKKEVCKECEGSGRLKKIIRYEKFNSIVEEATKLLGDDIKENKCNSFEEYLKTALVKYQ